MLLGGAVSCVALLASAAGLTYLYRKYQRLPRVELSGVLESETPAGEAGNILLVGVDNASGLDDDDPVRRGRDDLNRSDTIMVLRIEPDDQTAALLSLPRDLWVPVPDTNTSSRINSLIDRGGPELLVRAIDEYLGIPIKHYVQVDFASFQGLVDAIDGVPVYFPHPARDRRSGLVVRRAGCTTLDPRQALAYVRSRYYEEHVDGSWTRDPRGDIGRITRQQDFIRRALSRAISRGVRNPGVLDQLIDVGLEGITVDDELTADEIFSLGRRFRTFEPDNLVTYSVPVVDDEVGGASILRLDEEGAEEVLARFRTSAEGDDVAPEAVRVQVENGSGRTGQGSEAARDLGEVGFAVESVANAPGFSNDRTVIEYGPGQASAADAVARWLVVDAELRETDTRGIVVVTGADWAGVRDEPRPPVTSPEDGDGTDGDDDPADGDEGAGRGGETSPDDAGEGSAATGRDGDGTSGEPGDGRDGGAADGGDGSSGTTSTTVDDRASHPC